MLGCACCSLSEEGAEALAAFLKHSRKLEELVIYMNDIGDAGAEKVSDYPTSVSLESPFGCTLLA